MVAERQKQINDLKLKREKLELSVQLLKATINKKTANIKKTARRKAFLKAIHTTVCKTKSCILTAGRTALKLSATAGKFILKHGKNTSDKYIKPLYLKLDAQARKQFLELINNVLPGVIYYSKEVILKCLQRFIKGESVESIIRHEIKNKELYLPDADVSFKKGQKLYKGFTFQRTSKVLHSLEHFYITEVKNIAELYHRQPIEFHTAKNLKLFNLTIDNLKAVIAYIGFNYDEQEIFKFVTGLGATAENQKVILQKFMSYDPVYLDMLLRRYFPYRNMSANTGKRISILEIDKKFSGILCSKFFKKFRYDGYWASKLPSTNGQTFHTEIMLCDATEAVIEDQLPVLGLTRLATGVAETFIYYQRYFKYIKVNSLPGVLCYLSGGLALRTLVNINNSSINKNNKNIIRDTTDFDFKFILNEPSNISRHTTDIHNYVQNILEDFTVKLRSSYSNNTIKLSSKVLLNVPRGIVDEIGYTIYYTESWYITIQGVTIDLVDATLIWKKEFTRDMIDTTSIFPILKLKYMVKEISAVLVKSFVGSKPINKRRNPITGTNDYRPKGLKDLARLRGICEINKKNINRSFCDKIHNLSNAVKKQNINRATAIASSLPKHREDRF